MAKSKDVASKPSGEPTMEMRVGLQEFEPEQGWPKVLYEKKPPPPKPPTWPPT
jgi:hypothetical protein